MGATEEQARETAQKKGYGDKVAVVKTSFKANTKVCICGWQAHLLILAFAGYNWASQSCLVSGIAALAFVL